MTDLPLVIWCFWPDSTFRLIVPKRAKLRFIPPWRKPSSTRSIVSCNWSKVSDHLDLSVIRLPCRSAFCNVYSTPLILVFQWKLLKDSSIDLICCCVNSIFSAAVLPLSSFCIFWDCGWKSRIRSRKSPSAKPWIGCPSDFPLEDTGLRRLDLF